MALLACSGSPTPSGGETGSMQLSAPLPAEALLCSGDLRWGHAMGALQHALSLNEQLGVRRGRRTKIAFPQQGKRPTLPHPCGLMVPYNGSRSESAAWASRTAGVQSSTDPTMALTPRHHTKTQLPRRGGGASPGTC